MAKGHRQSAATKAKISASLIAFHRRQSGAFHNGTQRRQFRRVQRYENQFAVHSRASDVRTSSVHSRLVEERSQLRRIRKSRRAVAARRRAAAGYGNPSPRKNS